jgi:hypothetical protein
MIGWLLCRIGLHSDEYLRYADRWVAKCTRCERRELTD